MTEEEVEEEPIILTSVTTLEVESRPHSSINRKRGFFFFFEMFYFPTDEVRLHLDLPGPGLPAAAAATAATQG